MSQKPLASKVASPSDIPVHAHVHVYAVLLSLTRTHMFAASFGCFFLKYVTN